MRKIISVVLLCSPLPVYAGPFGLDAGTPLSKITIVETRGNGNYVIKVPQPHPSFDSYMARISTKFGLCKVNALGKTLYNDAYGTEAKSQFKSISESLNQKYGSSKNFDFLRYKSIWNEPNDWAMAVSKKERTLANFWDRESGSSLSEDISGISLEARSLGMDKTYITLSYEFSNFDQCLSEQKQTADSVL